jgi:hypothetical protein
MKTLHLLSILFLFFFTNEAFGQRVTLSGTVREAGNGEEIIGAEIRVKDSSIAAVTNEYGFYSLTLDTGTYVFVVSSMGFDDIEFTQQLTSSLSKSFEMQEPKAAEELQEVIVTSRRQDANIKDPGMGVERLDPKELAKLPVIFGEKDIIKTMQLLPGVKNAGEGNSGYYVRGGSADQNLILLDEAPVYNASHLLGFFSTFNSDAIKDAVLYKGNQPANFGGRLSSVLDIKMNDGNQKRFNVGGGIGLIASRLAVEGPIVKDKGSFLISGRRTYADVFLKLTDQFKDNQLYFYDLNAKANYRITAKDRIFLSGYFGRDVLAFQDVFGINWGNATGTFRWNRIISEKLFSNTSLIYSSYDYKISIESGDVDFDITSKIVDYNIRQEFQYFPNNRNKMRFGANVIRHAITPGQIDVNNNTSGINAQKLNATPSIESAVFFTNDWTVSEKLRVSYGLRGSAFSVHGNGQAAYTFDEEGNADTGIVYRRNEILKTYFFLEPRVSLSFAYNDFSSFKAAYSRNTQNIHLVSNATSASPTDVILGSTLNTKPEISDQVAVGWFRNFSENRYEFNVETYYKAMQNQIDYRNGANTQANELLEGELLYGIGRAYGVELIMKKKEGRLTGWIGYTIARTERKVDGINEGNWYAARQDRTHDISVVAVYDITPKLSVSALFIYYTGNAVTFPSGKYMVNGKTQFIYTERNGYRMPDYHRLDLGVTWIRKNTEKFESSWNFSIYNAYGRENAYSITFRANENNPAVTEAVQTTLFRWVPAITYNFKFK